MDAERTHCRHGIDGSVATSCNRAGKERRSNRPGGLGSLLDRKDEVLISLGAPAQMTLLPFDVKMEWDPELPEFEAPAAITPGMYGNIASSPDGSFT